MGGGGEADWVTGLDVGPQMLTERLCLRSKGVVSLSPIATAINLPSGSLGLCHEILNRFSPSLKLYGNEYVSIVHNRNVSYSCIFLAPAAPWLSRVIDKNNIMWSPLLILPFKRVWQLKEKIHKSNIVIALSLLSIKSCILRQIAANCKHLGACPRSWKTLHRSPRSWLWLKGAFVVVHVIHRSKWIFYWFLRWYSTQMSPLSLISKKKMEKLIQSIASSESPCY